MWSRVPRLVVFAVIGEMLLLASSFTVSPASLRHFHGSGCCQQQERLAGLRVSPSSLSGGPVAEDEEQAGEGGDVLEVKELDLRTCAAEDVDLIARTFSEGFFTRDGETPPARLMGEIAADKAQSIQTRFREAPPGADSSTLLPAAVVMTRLNGRVVGFASVFGAIRVRDSAGSRLLTGREAEAFLVSLSQASAEERMQITTRRAALLCDVTVLPEARRRGLGQQLCHKAARMASQWGYSDLLLLVNDDNLPAKALYEKLGFRDGGTRCASVEERVEDGKRIQCSVSNLLLSKSTRTKTGAHGRLRIGAGLGRGPTAEPGAKQFKLFARTREEEILRKQLVGHLIPAVAVLAFAAAMSTSPVGAFWAPL
mmetsp:Transcript_23711/g.69411  ORF Transcript_23711/g.69411 Transcript_23711/m.69411 type:complete len:369 (-) Transcript_23711:107-1213(-)